MCSGHDAKEKEEEERGMGTREQTNHKRNREDEEIIDPDSIVDWMRRDALLRAREELLCEGRESATRILTTIKDRLNKHRMTMFALAIEGQELGIRAMQPNPIADSLAHELKDMAEFQDKLLRVEQLEQEWGPYQTSKL
jgi:hypothetical protein